jgi:hypothetical protein
MMTAPFDVLAVWRALAIGFSAQALRGQRNRAFWAKLTGCVYFCIRRDADRVAQNRAQSGDFEHKSNPVLQVPFRAGIIGR